MSEEIARNLADISTIVTLISYVPIRFLIQVFLGKNTKIINIITVIIFFITRKQVIGFFRELCKQIFMEFGMNTLIILTILRTGIIIFISYLFKKISKKLDKKGEMTAEEEKLNSINEISDKKIINNNKEYDGKKRNDSIKQKKTKKKSNL